MNTGEPLTGGNSRAVYRADAGAAPALLPCLSDPCASRATAINSFGVISGTANDVLDDGTAGGVCDPTRMPFTPNEVPVIWGAFEAVTELPLLPEGFLDGALRRMNDLRDGVGVVRTNDGTDPTYVYGALWINDGGTYVTVLLTYFVNDITPRTADGSSFLVASDAGRVRVWKDADSWNYTVDANPGGAGTAINAAGDMVGVMVKGGWLTNGGTPYLLTAGGTLTKLPLPSRATGIAADVSGDPWVAGWLYLRTEHPAAVWTPVN